MVEKKLDKGKDSKTENKKHKDAIKENLEYDSYWNPYINMLIIDIICSECRGSKDRKRNQLLGIPEINETTWNKTIKNMVDMRRCKDEKNIEKLFGFISEKIPFLMKKAWYNDILPYTYHERELLKEYAMIRSVYENNKDKYTGREVEIRIAKSVNTRYRNILNALVRNEWHYKKKYNILKDKLEQINNSGISDSKLERDVKQAEKEWEDYKWKIQKYNDVYAEHNEENNDLIEFSNMSDLLKDEVERLRRQIVKGIKDDYEKTTIFKRPDLVYEKIIYYLKFEEHHVEYDVEAYIKSSIAYIDAETLWNTIINLDNKNQLEKDTFENFISAMEDQISVAKAAYAIWKINRKRKEENK